MAHRSFFYTLQWISITALTTSVRSETQQVIVHVGRVALLECMLENSNEWRHYPVQEGQRHTVSLNKVLTVGYASRFSVDSDNKLSITSVEIPDAGKYCCLAGKNKTCLELTVIDQMTCSNNASKDGVVGSTDCFINILPEAVEHYCRTAYYGHTPPVVNWRSGSISLQGHSQISPPQNIVHSELTQSVMSAVHPSKATCDISGHICTSSFTLLYAFNATTITMVTNGSVHCIANASGPCSYEWMRAGDKTFSKQGQILDITDPNIIPHGMYICMASCAIRDQTCVVKAMEIMYVSDSDSRIDKSGAYIFFTASMIALTVCVGFIISIFYRFKKRILRFSRNEIQHLRHRFGFTKDEDELLLRENGCALGLTKIAIRGIAILKQQIFIVGESSKIIHCYNSTDYRRERTIEIKMLGGAWGMAACAQNNRLYVSEFDNKFAAILHKVELDTDDVKFFEISKDFRGAPVNVSVTYKHTVLVSGANVLKLEEHRADGERIREISLDSTITGVRQAIWMTDDTILIAHGLFGATSLHRICKINPQNGSIISSIRGDRPGLGGSPFDVVLNQTETKMFTSIFYGKRVLMLNSSLEIEEHASLSNINWDLPMRLAFDDATQLLYVADFSGGVQCINISGDEDASSNFTVNILENKTNESTLEVRRISDSDLNIRGMAILKNSLYTVADNSQHVDVFSLGQEMKKIQTIGVEALNSAFGMAACEKFNCLYLSEYFNTIKTVESQVEVESGLVIHKVILETNEASQLHISTSFCNAWVNVSVTPQHTVLAVGPRNLEEYKSNGDFVRKMSLNPQLQNMQQVICLDDATILMVIGILDQKDRGVYRVNSVNGEIETNYLIKSGYFTDLVVSRNQKLVFVPVINKNQVLVLSPTLDKIIKLIDFSSFSFSFPFRVTVDDINKKLYVSSWPPSAHIVVVDVKGLL